ncbi:MAG: arsenosugar biosynthesis radical SAM protein ArsS [Gammaproteobacteria bacterium]|nr:arsenosugar biosynthesis radical SAM protein ArsS [Gammaproteobacteria bacterium]
MHETLHLLETSDFPEIHRARLETLQVNLGYRCNQSCVHCHVNAGPNRKEMMSPDTLETVLAYLHARDVQVLDITGGAPELHPQFRELVERARGQVARVIDRCNLTILEEPGQESLAQFLAAHKVEVVASLPCYLEENVDRQRGKGVFQQSLRALRQLNALGYGTGDADLRLTLVYNPQGPDLPPPQEGLEKDYHEYLLKYGVRFDHLFTLTNMPIQRFGSTLVSQGKFDEYMQLLRNSYCEKNLQAVMCRSLISVDWRGYVYDCDFNQMLGLPLSHNNQVRTHLSELMDVDLEDSEITVADHCYGCTAGQGSSCGGSLS